MNWGGMGGGGELLLKSGKKIFEKIKMLVVM